MGGALSLMAAGFAVCLSRRRWYRNPKRPTAPVARRIKVPGSGVGLRFKAKTVPEPRFVSPSYVGPPWSVVP